MKIYWSPLSYTPTVTIGGSFAGYPIENIKNTAINLDWFQDVAGTDSAIRFDLGSDQFIAGFFLHKFNLTDESDIEVSLVTDGGTKDDVTVPDDAIQTDNNDRTRFFLDLVDLGFYGTAYRYIDFRMLPGATIKSGGFYNIGAAYLLNARTQTMNPRWSMTHNQQRPTLTQVLANGARAYATAGPPYEVFDMRFQAIRDRFQFPDFDLLNAIKAGPFILDYEYHPWLVYPCIMDDFRTNTTLNSGFDEIQFKLRELVTI